MNDYKGKVVVITGAANGIGKELARQYAAKGAKLSLADIDVENLSGLEKDLKASGVEVSTAMFDVTNYGAMEAFAQRTFATYGTVDFFFNNAGVISVGSIWDQPLQDWKWLMDVNVMGIVHGIKAFVPAMIKQDKECRIINTASIAGLLTVENSPAYVASKFASLSLTEVLELQLQDAGSKVKAHVICPAVVATDLNNCLRHRAKELYNPEDPYYQTEDYKKRDAVVQSSMKLGLPVEKAVEIIIEGIENDQFYILTHPVYNLAIVARANGIVEGIRPAKVKR
ncbi:SDR family NAD(P)-dependent oxidoreductase [Desulfosporosinus fructosivorans]|uniref:SDR family NAD(P)-dependent oxidoreductase n=1 Tax=Desulfosporosinus fructosivorans TaxID=2018669 RepID=A0A4Z0R4C2_9FIRM|nr:SDR family NAD(P)-dependent oxidoreductase [Desulfosporosinus fructosivorans]TGE37023.1 SDR family NAD(P)-dependent oxidoreductase [Desulfosporosinus fructosivorans]